MLEKPPPQRYNGENDCTAGGVAAARRNGGYSMQRHTQKQEDGYTAEDLPAAIRRLGKWEDMYEALLSELEKTAADMAALAAAGKEKSATYRQLFAAKLTLLQFKSRLEISLR